MFINKTMVLFKDWKLYIQTIWYTFFLFFRSLPLVNFWMGGNLLKYDRYFTVEGNADIYMGIPSVQKVKDLTYRNAMYESIVVIRCNFFYSCLCCNVATFNGLYKLFFTDVNSHFSRRVDRRNWSSIVTFSSYEVQAVWQGIFYQTHFCYIECECLRIYWR